MVTDNLVVPAGSSRIQILHIGARALHALARGDLGAANAPAGVPLSAYFAGPDWRNLWRRRSVQVREDPDRADWITGVIWDPVQELSVAGPASMVRPM